MKLPLLLQALHAIKLRLTIKHRQRLTFLLTTQAQHTMISSSTLPLTMKFELLVDSTPYVDPAHVLDSWTTGLAKLRERIADIIGHSFLSFSFNSTYLLLLNMR
jgi:hypothetical protein